jgi:hypothetical protein
MAPISLARAPAASRARSITSCECLGHAFINGPVSCHTNTIPLVCSSVQEAEYDALFAAARIADNERSILHNLGYPPPL